jgi:ribosomal protein S18 acetylase RimI-like enzyme
VQLTLDRARERRAARVELDVSSANAAALALYARFGFTTGKDPGTKDLLMGVKL